MVTASRRTPPRLHAKVVELVKEHQGFFWDGTGENPYIALLALADAVVVTADSTNMVGESVSTGAPVLVFELRGGAERHRVFIESLKKYGAVRPFTGHLESFSYQPLDSTPGIATAVLNALIQHRRRLGLVGRCCTV